MLKIYALYCLISFTFFGLYIVRRGKKRIGLMKANGEPYDFWREDNLLYLVEVGYHDLADWIEWNVFMIKEARRIAKKKAALTSLRKRVRERALSARKSCCEEKSKREEEMRQLVNAVDRASSRTAILMFLLSFLPVAIVLISSVVVTKFESLGHIFGLIMVISTIVLFASDRLSNISFSADISADVIGKVLLEHQEEGVKKSPVRPVRTQDLNTNKNKRAYSSTVDVGLRAVRNRNGKKRRK